MGTLDDYIQKHAERKVREESQSVRQAIEGKIQAHPADVDLERAVADALESTKQERIDYYRSQINRQIVEAAVQLSDTTRAIQAMDEGIRRRVIYGQYRDSLAP